jgi:lipopolysaccharide export system protein LptA/lipopolysaccharide export system protein LptC
MKRSEAARYARWSAAVAGLLALLTAGAYIKREVKARIERKLAPAAAALNIARESNGVKFSKGEGDHKEFTVEASKSTDFKDRDLTELESVVITIFGKNGERHDVIHTKSCQYTKNNGDVVCSGEVQMDLESAADFSRSAPLESPAAQHAPAAPPPQVMHVETRAVTFNRASGFAATASPVAFVFPNGNGKGTGMEYRSEIGTVKLLHDVQLRLRAPLPAAPRGQAKPAAHANSSAANALSPGEEVTVVGTSLDFDRNSRVMHVLGPASAESKSTRLTAGELTMDLDPQFRARQLLASGSVGGELPRIISQSKTGRAEMSVSGERLTAQFAPEGWVSSVNAQGNVRGSRNAGGQRDDAKSEQAFATMWPRTNEIRELQLRGNVNLQTVQLKPELSKAAQPETTAAWSPAAGDDTRTLTTSALRIQFSGGKVNEVSRPVQAETLAAGRMEWNDTSGGNFSLAPAPAAKSAQANAVLAQGAKGVAGALNANVNETNSAAHTTLSADKLQMKFGALGKAKDLLAAGHVQTERTAAGKPAQTATAAQGVAQLLAAGGWSQMDLDGDVHLHEGDRSGQSDHAVFRHVEQTATLTGRALVRDASTETAAAKIIFAQNTGDIHAEGGVRSTDLPGHSPTVQLAPSPTHITAEALQGNSQSGRALYSGHARMWQGESVLEADAIELLRDTRVLNARNNVRAVFPQSAGSPSPPPSPTAASLLKTSATGAKSNLAKSNLWHVTAGSLVYSDAENHAHLEKNVIAQSVDQKMRAPVVDLYFTRAATATATSGSLASEAKASPAGPQQISKVVGTGGVIVEEAARKAVADRGVYTASDGKFVMSGGNPTLYDGAAGNTSGRQLTFFLADDTIIVDSENGSRILTKHRVDNQAN